MLPRKLSKRHSQEHNRDDPGSSSGHHSFSRNMSTRKSRRRRRAEPEMHQSKEEFIQEWGITPEDEEKRVRAVMLRLRKEGITAPDMPPYYHDYYVIRRFVRARQHDVERAFAMFAAHAKWRAEVGADTILDTFEFTERDSFLTIYPQGYHKTDKLGRPMYIQKLGSIDLKKIYEVTSEERMVKFRIQEWERCLRYIMPVCSKVAGQRIEQTFAVLDVQGVGLKHLTGEVKRMLGKVTQMDQDNYPEMLGRTCVINAPAVFKMIWTVVKPMLDLRTQNKIEVCPRDYTSALLNWVDAENLPTYLGGLSKATLLDDEGPWRDKNLLAEVESDYRRQINAQSDDEVSTTDGEDAASISRPPTLKIPRLSSSMQSGHNSEVEDYYSPRSEMSVASFVSPFHSRSLIDGKEEVPPDVKLNDGLGVSAAVGMPVSTIDGGSPRSPSTSASLLARIKGLEQQVADQAKRLGHNPHAAVVNADILGDGTLSSRVKTLEYAVEALLRAQEMELQQQREEQQSKAYCSGCCVVQ